MIVDLSVLIAVLRERVTRLRSTRDAGYTTETVVVTAGLVALAIAVGLLLTGKITAWANGINFGG